MIVTKIQIRFADIDVLGHVNNVNLQHFFDQGKVDYIQKVLGLSGVWRKEGFVQARTETDYLAQVFMKRIYASARECVDWETKASHSANRYTTLTPERSRPLPFR